jgi:hypothetical protein
MSHNKFIDGPVLYFNDNNICVYLLTFSMEQSHFREAYSSTLS